MASYGTSPEEQQRLEEEIAQTKAKREAMGKLREHSANMIKQTKEEKDVKDEKGDVETFKDDRKPQNHGKRGSGSNSASSDEQKPPQPKHPPRDWPSDWPKSKKGKKEKNLTVKPIRLQLEEQGKNSLKKTLKKVGIQVCEVSPLETQIAGHGSCDDGLDGMLQHSQGFVLKPVQPPPRGQREVDFYTNISSSTLADDLRFRELTPKFHGVENIKMANGEESQFLMLGEAKHRSP